MKRCSRNIRKSRFLILLAAISWVVCGTSTSFAQESESGDSPSEEYGVWNYVKSSSGEKISQMRLRVYPQAAPVPAFRHRLVPDPNDRVEGNSALFYLKAMGFFEQNSARETLAKLYRKWRDQDPSIWPPNAWVKMAPESMPMDQVREYLWLHSFQPEFLYDAARRTRFEHDRAIERESNPIGYLLPSIQQHRELARVQNVRCRFAMAEGRIDDAVEIVGQLMAMGSHLGGDEFLVSSLVGAACHRIGTGAGLVLSQQPDAPNLYWAIAACPDPAIDLSRAIANERKLLLMQLPILKEVTEAVRPPQFWADFTRRFTKVRNDFANEINEMHGESSTDDWDTFKAATIVAAEYSIARDFLGKVTGMSDEQLDRYHQAQVVFLSVVKYNEFAQDELLKQFVLPVASRQTDEKAAQLKHWRRTFSPSNDGPVSNNSFLAIGDIFTPATQQVLAAAAAVEQAQNLWQTVEALRLTAAENGGKFPETLAQLVVPAPLDPATNEPYEYKLNDGFVTLRCAKISGHIQHEIKLELLPRNQQQEKTE